MLATALWRLRNGLGQCRAGRGRLDDLVHDANLDGPRQTTGEPVVLRRQLLLHGRALGIGHLSQPPAMQNPNSRNRAHDRDMCGRPGKDPGRPERA